ncbi:MAG: LamG-like jellyroll fold domain-containing protein, partial [Saprospiraceae bacterium]
VEIAKTGGDVLMPSDFIFNNGQLRGTGYINTTGFLKINNSYAFNFNGTIDDMDVNSGYGKSVSLGKNLVINDTLQFTSVSNMSGDTIKVHGDIVSNTSANHTNYIKLVGNTDQTISGTGYLRYVEIAKTGGDVLMPSDFIFSDGQLRGDGYINTTGKLRFLNNYTLNFTGTIDDVEFTSTYGKSMSLGENLTVNDSLIITGLYISGDTIKVHGDVISNSSTNSSSLIKLVGATDQTIAGTGSIRNFFLNKPSGNLLFGASYGKSFATFRVDGYEWDVNGETITASNFYIADNATIKGTGTLTGNLVVENGGIVNPGSSPGCLVVTGNLNLQGGSKYIAEFGGTTACSDYDQLQVGGTATISGDLEVALINGYSPVNGTAHNIVTSTNQSGTFNTVTASNGYEVSASYSASGIIVNANPLPGSALDLYYGNNVAIPLASTANFTIEGSFKADPAFPIVENIFVWQATNPNRETIIGLMADGTLRVGQYDYVNFIFEETFTTGTYRDGNWYDVALTKDGNDLKLYIDGQLEASLTINASNVASTGLDTFRIGAMDVSYAAGLGEFYIGQVDEVRVWNTARTCSELDFYRNCELTGSETGLMAYYQFNQGDAGADNSTVTTLTDATTNGNDGILNGFNLAGTTSNWILDGAVTSGTTCSGSASSPEITVNDAVIDGTYGSTYLGNTVTKTFTITNDGNDNLELSTITSDNAAFEITGFSANTTVGASTSTTFSVEFTPTILSNESANIVIANNDCDEGSYEFTVTGSGVQPTLVIGTDSVCVGENVTIPVELQDGLGIGSFSIQIDFDNTTLQYVNNSNLNTLLNNGNLQITDVATANTNGYITMSWFDGTSINGKDFSISKLLDLEFTTLSTGATNLTWNTTGSNGDVTDGLGNLLTTINTNHVAYAHALPTPTIVANDTSVCDGEMVIFTATGGVSYEFFVNGVSQGAASATSTLMTNTLVDGDEVDVYATNMNGCTDSSSVITMTIYSLPVAGISSSDADDAICIGDAVTFTATGGVSYEFLLNGTTVQAASATDIYTTNALVDGDAISVIVTNANGCISTSSGISTTVNPLPTAGITSDDIDNVICAGDVVTFTATGGVSYEFLLNGATIQAASATDTYATNALADGDAVSVIVTNVNGCISTSSAITTTVNPLPTAGVTSSDADNAICLNESVTFTATGGVSYEFLLNGATAQAASATDTYTTSTLADGDAVSVIVTNVNGCISTSSAITTTVRPLPVAQNVTGGGDFCPNNGGTVIGLDGSETDVSYQLIFNGSVIETIAGTGSAVDFTGVMTTSTTGDVYTVSAFNTTNTDCVFDMNGSATVILTCFDITTSLIYDNGNNQGMKNTAVILRDKTGATVATETTDNNGQVTFTNVENGIGYYIDADLSGKPHGGINATDALLVALDFANHITLVDMKERASDVDANGSNNANDALQISKRYVGNAYTFAADWLHDNDNTNAFDVNGMDMTMTSLVLAYGDVNGSYDVSGLSNGNKSIISLYNEGEVLAEENAVVEIPFYTKERIETGAISMVMNFPYDVFDIENITVGNNATNVLYEIVEGRIRLSWFNIAPIELAANEALFTITAKVHNNLANAYTPTITFGNETELADGTGNVITQISLTSPTITLPNQTVLGRSMNLKQMIYPNPATIQTTLEYNLPSDARVTIELYDAVGRRVTVLTNANQTKGVYSLLIDTQELNSGLYKVRTIISTKKNTDVYTKQLMIAK